jgi:hypothetical protein
MKIEKVIVKENNRIIRDRELTADDVIDDDNSTHILCEIS